ncbi:ABC transporter G family member 7 [Astathelohania contejeani]|uniref:ABC transporter G family member 7 n=1 Tax=Astathelohania contejeani TaxID=164912 RepID=A0ABQ7I0U1_9MICR|nr:ABC transporter G family member 7 [Thelohania contejeani]
MPLTTHQAQLCWSNLKLSTKIKEKIIINNVTGTIGPKSMYALMGGSGAGKSSLMNALAGRLPPETKLKGKIRVNTCERNIKTWPLLISYVEQEFYSYETMTVYETLEFSACMRLNKPASSVKSGVIEILNVLGLLPISDQLLKNISGGEKKRVAIGVELVSNPHILFLDEPLSGLDSYNGIKILGVLRNLLSFNKTILVTIHQPSEKMLEMFDGLILMHEGEIIFQGTIEECKDLMESCGYPKPENMSLSEHFLDVVSLDVESIDTSQERINKVKTKWKIEFPNQQNNQLSETLEIIEPESVKLKLFSLIERNIKCILRDLDYLKIQCFQKLSLILLFGLSYLRLGYEQEDIQSRIGVIFFIMLNSLFGTCSPLFNIFPIEKRIIKRERNSGMYDGITAYVAKFISQLPFILFFNIIYITSVYWMVGLSSNVGKFVIFLIIQISLLFASLGIGLTIGTVAPTSSFAQVLGSTIVLVFVIFGGSFSNPDTIPSWLRWIIWISPVNYGFRASMQNQFSGEVFSCNDNSMGCISTGEDIIDKYGVGTPSIWPCIFCLWGLILVYIIIGSILLHYITRMKINIEDNVESV